MPQPMSTPTAAGMIAPSVGITLPTVAPMPEVHVGHDRDLLVNEGHARDALHLRAGPASNGTPTVQALNGHARRRRDDLVGCDTFWFVSLIMASMTLQPSASQAATRWAGARRGTSADPRFRHI